MDETPISVEKNLMPKNLLNFKKIRSDIMIEKHDAYEPEEDDLEVKYDKIWKRYSNYLDCNFDDFISLDHLGKVLDYLKVILNLYFGLNPIYFLLKATISILKYF